MRPQQIVDMGVSLLGRDRGVVLVEQHAVAALRWANSTLTTNGLSAAQQVCVVAQPELPGGLASGTASGTVTEAADLAELVGRARRAAVGSGPAQDAADEVAVRPASPDWSDPAEGVGPDDLAAVSLLLGDVLPARDVEHYGYAEHAVTTSYLGTTGGLRLRHVQPTARFELSGKSQGRTRSAWAGRSGRHFDDMDLATTADEVRRGLAAQATRIEVPPGRHTVVLSPSAVADLMVYLVWSAGALDALEGRSAFSRAGGGTRIGERLATVPFWLRSDPRSPGLECADHLQAVHSSPVSSPFDAGLPRGATDWIAEGTLRALMTTRHSATLAGIGSTPPVDNLLAGVGGASGTLDEVAARVGDGLVVTCLWYIREVDPQSLLLTGLTRDGVYVVRGGEVVGAAGNYRFNESPLGILRRIADAGTPTDCLPREWADWFARTRMAPLAIAEFNLSSASEAV
ncbi:MAG: metallopeptidase TldD-related protein [Candidatus Nanopelagicales bacterium]